MSNSPPGLKRFLLLLVLLGLYEVGRVGADQPPAPEVETRAAARQIDALLAQDWSKHQLQPNPPASDETLVRRLYLDIAGRIPTGRETEEFLAATDPDKRSKLIDKLLAGEGYALHFFNFWADILRAQSRQTGGAVPREAYLVFLKESLRSNKPYDQLVRELVGAQGKAWQNGAIGYYLRDTGMPLDNLAITTRIFLGTRIECAQCHNHPFDVWTQKQFYEMAAFTYGVDTVDHYDGVLVEVLRLIRERDTQGRIDAKSLPEAERKAANDAIFLRRKYIDLGFGGLRAPFRNTNVGWREKKLTLPHDYQYEDAEPLSPVQPATMLGPPAAGDDRLQAFARWMTSPENPRFTTVVVNRLWKKLLGRGLIEPLDELHEYAEPANPELQAYLERLLIAQKYDMQAFLRVVLNTQTYQRCATTADLTDDEIYHFTGPLLRRMTAEQMWDSFVTLINLTPDMPDMTERRVVEQRRLAAKKAGDAIELLTAEEILAGLDSIAQKYADEKASLKILQDRLAEATARGDIAAGKALTTELYQLKFLPLEAMADYIYAPALQKLAEKVAGKKLPDLKLVGTSAMPPGELRFTHTIFDRVNIPGYEPAMTAADVQAEREREKARFLDEAAYYGIPEAEQGAFVAARLKAPRDWLRAAELDSPAPRGHYLREFGQSDRDVVENANLNASVPQALALMNGTLLPRVLDRYSQLMLSVNKSPDADKTEIVYLTLLSRKPTAREQAVWQQAREQGLTNIEDLIYSLLNTQQFIFIQ